MEVRLADEVPNALASLLAERLGLAAVSHPGVERLAHGGVVAIRAADVGLTVSVTLGPEMIEVRNGKDRSAEVGIVASASDLMELADSPTLFGLPNPFRRRGRRVLSAILGRRIRLEGALRHPAVATRFSRLLGAA